MNRTPARHSTLGTRQLNPAPFAQAESDSFTWLKDYSLCSPARAAALRGALIILPFPRGKQQKELHAILSARNRCVLARDPRLAYARLLKRHFGHLQVSLDAGSHPLAHVHPSARIGRRVTLAPFSCVGSHAVIADDTVIHPGVIIHSRTRIGRACVIGANTVVGGPGFGFARDGRGAWQHFPQTGRVVLQDDVWVGASTTIDRPGLGETRILRGSKIDSQCHIGHNARIGPHAIITACAEIGAGVIVRRGAWVGPGTTSIEGVRIGANSLVGIGAAVLHDVPPRATVAGSPARPTHLLREEHAAVRRLVEGK